MLIIILSTHLSAMRVRFRSTFDLVANVTIATRKSGLQRIKINNRGKIYVDALNC
jgi:hypothetical protein